MSLQTTVNRSEYFNGMKNLLDVILSNIDEIDNRHEINMTDNSD